MDEITTGILKISLCVNRTHAFSGKTMPPRLAALHVNNMCTREQARKEAADFFQLNPALKPMAGVSVLITWIPDPLHIPASQLFDF